MKNFTHRTDIGLIRERNEDICDSFSIKVKNQEVYCAVLADGMGGHQAGEVASEIFVQVAKNIIQNLENSKQTFINWRTIIESIFYEANQSIFETSRMIQKEGMGTTGVVGILDGNRFIGGWIGDSRIYKYSYGSLVQTSKDHSMVQMLIDNGQIKKEDGRSHPKKHILLRAIGTTLDDCLPDIVEYNLNVEELILLCSDGLSGKLQDEEIASLIELGLEKGSFVKEKYKTEDKTIDLKDEIIKNDPLYYTTGLLISKAKDNGGEDNISVCMLKCDQEVNTFWMNLRRFLSHSNRKINAFS